MNLNETEKVAVLLVALGPTRAQRILDRLSTNELVLIVDAMRRLGNIRPEIRRQVLEEVNDILQGIANRDPKQPAASLPELPDAPQTGIDLFEKLGPYLPGSIDPSRIDWDSAGFDFGDSEDRWRRRGSGDPHDGSKGEEP